MEPKKPGLSEAQKILDEVDARLREEEDAKGDLKNTGEARGLLKMRKEISREIDKDATDFLKKHGFNGWGLKAKPGKKGGRK